LKEFKNKTVILGIDANLFFKNLNNNNKKMFSLRGNDHDRSIKDEFTTKISKTS